MNMIRGGAVLSASASMMRKVVQEAAEAVNDHEEAYVKMLKTSIDAIRS